MSAPGDPHETYRRDGERNIGLKIFMTWSHDDIIEYEAKRQGVDPDLVRAIVYVENAQGWYGHLFEAFHVAKTIFPMNINPKTGARLVGVYADFYDPFTNIRAGVALIRRLQERIANPTVAKVD